MVTWCDTNDKHDRRMITEPITLFTDGTKRVRLLRRKRDGLYYFSVTVKGCTLYARLSKNQTRKYNRYGSFPAQPSSNPELWRLLDKRLRAIKRKKGIKPYTDGQMPKTDESRTRYYLLTPAGKKQIRGLSSIWEHSSLEAEKELSQLILSFILKPTQKSLLNGGDR